MLAVMDEYLIFVEKTRLLGVAVAGAINHILAHVATLGCMCLFSRHHSRGSISDFGYMHSSVAIKYNKTSCLAWYFAFSSVFDSLGISFIIVSFSPYKSIACSFSEKNAPCSPKQLLAIFFSFLIWIWSRSQLT